MSSGDYSFDVENIGKMYCRGGTDQTPLNSHVVLKLLSAILAGEELEYEPKDFHRKYSPDAISLDGKRWFECGYNSKNKVKDIVLERKVEEIIFHRFHMRRVDEIFSKNDQVVVAIEKAKIRRPKVIVYIWQGLDVENVQEQLRRHNEVSSVKIEDNNGRVNLSFLINGTQVQMSGVKLTWEPR